jgi:hypothetical protein
MHQATSADRCCRILFRLADPSLLLCLFLQVVAILRRVRQFRCGEITPHNAQRFESDLQDLLREVSRLIVQWTFNQLESEERFQMPGQFLWQGEFYRRHEKSRLRNLSCLFGPIEVRRFCYQPLESAGRCLFPLDLQLGIVAGVATPALADLVGRLSADLTQRHVLDQLRSLGIGWGVSTLRRFQQTFAAALEEFRHLAQVQQVLTWLQQAADGAGKRAFTLAVGRDGIMLPIVKSQKYKEAAAATLSVLDRAGKRLGTVYLGQMPEAGQEQLSQQLTRLITDVLTQWTGTLPRLAYVTDAGHHPTVYFQNVLSAMLHPRTDRLLKWEWVIDYYHACEYITKLSEAIFGRGRAARAWAAKMRRWLKERPNGVFCVLRSAGALQTIRGLVGNEDDFLTAYRYLRERASKMNYVGLRRRKLPIGSGVTEAACKILFTQRFKQSGMKWTREGGAPILTFRTVLLSGVWSLTRDLYLGSYTKPQPVTPKRPSSETADFPLNTAI